LGIIRSTVLNAKNGVITEDRFQKLTYVQWLFHYYEVTEKQRQDDEILQLLLDTIEMVGIVANPKIGKKILDEKKLRKAQQTINAENFENIFNKIKEIMPKQITIKGLKETNNFILPKYSRKKNLGIVIGNEGGEKNGAG